MIRSFTPMKDSWLGSCSAFLAALSPFGTRTGVAITYPPGRAHETFRHG